MFWRGLVRAGRGWRVCSAVSFAGRGPASGVHDMDDMDERAFQRGFHHAALAAYRGMMGGCREPECFGLWVDRVHAWRGPDGGVEPPLPRCQCSSPRPVSSLLPGAGA